MYSVQLHRGTTYIAQGARWLSGLERWTGDRVVVGSNRAAATSLRNFGNSVYPALPVSFKEDTKSRRSLLADDDDLELYPLGAFL